MTSEQKVEQMLDDMSVAFSDSDIKASPELRDIIFNYAKELDSKRDYHLIASKLVKRFVMYYWETNKELPPAAIRLHNQVKPYATRYDGIAISTMLLPTWF
ncbi:MULTISPECIES: bacteriocin immunity protein [Leuconostoc]|uniref:Prebacteriocin n=2 Tax=Leuconostoc kimchii TaxID=136609 RepID=D5T3P5_LEUKI|nr:MULTISPECIES: bacteriocin immunity protein [Leuconostoc]ADG40894.1 hypothetical protein LKI_06775 [Leuconostoc kimchii IMSNU 11154]AEJ31132.1 hypothetical protein LGMK_05370 [Leuconostoc sp. C2]QBR48221.1 bacteriocin immunity protein [Leuconostoc kimchii]